MRKLLSNRRLPGGVTLGTASLLLLSAPVLGFGGTAAASAYILAALAAVVGAKTMAQPVAWDGWIIAVTGLLVAAMPWILGFAAISSALWSHVALGTLVVAAGVWALWTGRRNDPETDRDVVPPLHDADGSAIAP